MMFPSSVLKRWLLATLICLLTIPAAFAQDDMAPAGDGDGAAQTADAGGGDGPDMELGKTIYGQYCSSCHNLSDQPMTGPGFYGAVDRWNGNKEEMVYMIRNGGKAYIEAEREFSDYMAGLVEEYGQYMPAQGVSEEEAYAVIAYVDAESEPAQTASAAGGEGPAGPGISNDALFTGLQVILGILAVAVVALVVIIAFVIGSVNAKQEGKSFGQEEIRATLKGLATNKFLVGTVGFLVLAAGLTGTVQYARSIGLHHGYKPVQPVAFSHKKHAGELQIDCQYCHTGVTKSKSAYIPSTNICANCHHKRGGIQEGEKYGEKELGKVLASYYDEKPIEWVRIHNLPDLVYFNHSQHVAVAGLECEQCHGEVQEMEEVWQVNKLSMGWCLDCHRESEVDLTKNDYYKTTHGAYLKQGEQVKVTAAELGGLNCVRCHY